MLMSHDPSVHAEPTTEKEITTRNRLFNVDGFGMSWYTSTSTTFSPLSSQSSRPILHPVLYKTIQPPLHDLNFRSICANTSSKVVFAHIRAATATAITPTNNHPFTFGIHTIMHNGFISDFPKIKLEMSKKMTQEAYQHIQGGTDTEHFAALFMSFLCPDSAQKLELSDPNTKQEGDVPIPAQWEAYHTPKEIVAALEKTIAAIIDIQTSLLGDAAQPNDLNMAITDGRSFVACRFRNHATEQPPSMYYSTSAGVTLNRQFPDHPDGAKGPHGSGKGKSANGKEALKDAEGHNPQATKDSKAHGSHVIVASEPTTYKDAEWNLIEKNRVVLVGVDGLEGVQELKYPGHKKSA